MSNNRKIPAITEDRLDNSSMELRLTTSASSTSEKQVYAFLKGKEATQTFTTRIPKKLYSQFRRIAFEKNIKMNQIVVQLIKNYVLKNTN